jgi:hypothetical protein
MQNLPNLVPVCFCIESEAFSLVPTTALTPPSGVDSSSQPAPNRWSRAGVGSSPFRRFLQHWLAVPDSLGGGREGARPVPQQPQRHLKCSREERRQDRRGCGSDQRRRRCCWGTAVVPPLPLLGRQSRQCQWAAAAASCSREAGSGTRSVLCACSRC